MSPHSALTSKDIKLLFEVVEGGGRLRLATQGSTIQVLIGDQPSPEVGGDAVRRLAACGYLEGGPEEFTVTAAGREYADSMK